MRSTVTVQGVPKGRGWTRDSLTNPTDPIQGKYCFGFVLTTGVGSSREFFGFEFQVPVQTPTRLSTHKKEQLTLRLLPECNGREGKENVEWMDDFLLKNEPFTYIRRFCTLLNNLRWVLGIDGRCSPFPVCVYRYHWEKKQIKTSLTNWR